jgi:hypothetical protein
MADPNQPSGREVDLNRLVLAVGENPQPREDQVDGSGVIIPCDFARGLVSVFGGPRSGQRLNNSHMRS